MRKCAHKQMRQHAAPKLKEKGAWRLLSLSVSQKLLPLLLNYNVEHFVLAASAYAEEVHTVGDIAQLDALIELSGCGFHIGFVDHLAYHIRYLKRYYLVGSGAE